MKTFSIFLLLLPLATFGELKVGIATQNITPKLGIPLAGYYSERGADGIHDPLNAKVIVLETEGTRAALVALDLIGTLRSTVEEARHLIAKQTGIPEKNIMISGTHCHTGPIFAGNRRFDAIGGQNELAREYAQLLPQLVAAAVKEANSNLGPARAFFAKTSVESLAFNRRFHMRDGSVGWNPGKLNPNIVRPAGPADPELEIVYFEDAQARPVATYVNFAMHLDTVGGTQFSADYPFSLSECLARAREGEMLTLFTIGCAGDINHINVQSGKKQQGPAEAARIGTLLAAGVLRGYEHLQATSTNPVLRVSSEMVKLPLPKIGDEEIAEAEKIAGMVNDKVTPAPKFMDQVQAFKVLDVAERRGAPQEVEVQVIALGNDLAWVALPGEIFVELGLSIKSGSPFPQTIIAELANGSIGYIPTRRAYTEGNYEVVSARCGAGSGEILVESALRQLRQLFRD